MLKSLQEARSPPPRRWTVAPLMIRVALVSKRNLLNLLKYALAFGLLGWVIWRNWEPEGGNGLHDVWQRHFQHGEPVRWEFLASAVVIYLAALLLSFFRWYVLVRAVELPFRPLDGVR